MARVNIDACFFSDRRIDRLAALCGEHRFMTTGRLLYVWFDCYNRKSTEGTREQIEMQSEWAGDMPFADLMVRAFLADEIEEGRYRIRGLAGRIDYLIRNAENASRGGKTTAGKAKRGLNGRFLPSASPSAVQALSNQTLGSNQAESSPLLPSPTLPRKKEINARPSSLLDFPFESLYEKYPRHEGKKRGLEICRRQIKTERDFERLCLAVDRYSQHLQREHTEKKFIKHFNSFMHCWEEWVDEPIDGVKRERLDFHQNTE